MGGSFTAHLHFFKSLSLNKSQTMEYFTRAKIMTYLYLCYIISLKAKHLSGVQ